MAGHRRRRVGVGAEAKWNIGFLVLRRLAAGLLATPQRHLLRSRYLLAGALIAAALAAPDLVWQAMHGWPNLDVFRALQTAGRGQPDQSTGRPRSSSPAPR